MIKALDNRALLAEAYVVGPPSLRSYRDVEDHFGTLPHTHDVYFLKDSIETGALGVLPSTIDMGLAAPNVAVFLWMLQQYRSLATNSYLRFTAGSKQ